MPAAGEKIGPQANILCSLPQSAQAFGCGLSAFPICIHSLSFCSSLACSLPGFYPASKRLYLTFLSLVFVFDCQLTSFLNVKTVYCLDWQCTPYLINIMFNGAQVNTFSWHKPRGWGTHYHYVSSGLCCSSIMFSKSPVFCQIFKTTISLFS